METNTKVAIIGLGNIGTALAQDLSKSKRSFIIADRNLDKANELASSLGNVVEVTDINTAVKSAAIIIPAIPFEAIVPFMLEFNESLAGKTIIDVSNPIAPDADGGFKKIIDSHSSAGQINSQSLPANAKLVKALGTLGAASLLETAHQPEKATLFYANDDTSTNASVEQLIEALGFDALRIGGLDQSIRIEVFGDLHEFGALGKPVNKEGAISKL